ncbi:MAG: TetR/AcrR family transcriptional regulator [Bdellovibrionales bacterium]|nr:TetR/AcrR family transcriptional regulator [Bdellovibrionales bacterium]
MNVSERNRALYAKFLNFKPSRGDERRLRILEKTIELIGSGTGIEGTSFESIGKSLEMLRAHVAYYYPDREALIEAAIKLVVSTVQNYTVDHVRKAADEGFGKVDGFVDGTFAWVRDFPTHPRVILLLYYYASFNKSYKDLHDRVRRLGAERLAATVAEVLPTKKRRQAMSVAKWIQSLLTGHLVDYLTTHSTDLETLRKKSVREIHTYLKTI